MSTTSTPRSARSFAPCTSFSMLWPRGGSSSTVTRNSRAWSRERSRDGSAVTPSAGSLFQLGSHVGGHRHGAPRAIPAAGVAVHHLAHGADVGRGRPAAAPDDTRAGVQHAGGVVGHVGRRREVDQPLAVPARQVRHSAGSTARVGARPRGSRSPDVVEDARAHAAVGPDDLDRQRRRGRGRPRPGPGPGTSRARR